MKEDPDQQEYGEYEVESFLGKGSIAKVWLARHRRIGRRVALKTITLEQKFEDDEDQHEFYSRLQREVELCAAMQHPNIVSLYDVGYEGEIVSYFATELVDGEPLLARLRRTRPLPLDEAMSIAVDILRGLTYAHSKGIIHRDIKPANILLTAEGQAKIADFGVARPLHSSLTATRSLVGTPNYMSPEQVKTTPVSTRADLFSTGVVMYEMLTGVKPFSAPELSGILYNIVNHDPPPVNDVNPSVPQSIATIVSRLLKKKPDDRYASAAEALLDVDTALREPEPLALLAFETVGQTPHDLTSPLSTTETSRTTILLRRPIPSPLFWFLTLLLVTALAGSVIALRSNASRQKPDGVITPAQRSADAEKQRVLDAARTYVSVGRYPEAIVAYDALLARHPQSLVARAERDEATRLMEAAAPKAEVTKVARKPRRDTKEEVPAPKPPEKPSRWERFKRWWGEPPPKNEPVPQRDQN